MKKNLILMSALFAGSMIVNSGFGANLERNSIKREHNTELETQNNQAKKPCVYDDRTFKFNTPEELNEFITHDKLSTLNVNDLIELAYNTKQHLSTKYANHNLFTPEMVSDALNRILIEIRNKKGRLYLDQNRNWATLLYVYQDNRDAWDLITSDRMDDKEYAFSLLDQTITHFQCYSQLDNTIKSDLIKHLARERDKATIDYWANIKLSYQVSIEYLIHELLEIAESIECNLDDAYSDEEISSMHDKIFAIPANKNFKFEDCKHLTNFIDKYRNYRRIIDIITPYRLSNINTEDLFSAAAEISNSQWPCTEIILNKIFTALTNRDFKFKDDLHLNHFIKAHHKYTKAMDLLTPDRLSNIDNSDLLNTTYIIKEDNVLPYQEKELILNKIFTTLTDRNFKFESWSALELFISGCHDNAKAMDLITPDRLSNIDTHYLIETADIVKNAFLSNMPKETQELILNKILATLTNRDFKFADSNRLEDFIRAYYDNTEAMDLITPDRLSNIKTHYLIETADNIKEEHYPFSNLRNPEKELILNKILTTLTNRDFKFDDSNRLKNFIRAYHDNAKAMDFITQDRLSNIETHYLIETSTNIREAYYPLSNLQDTEKKLILNKILTVLTNRDLKFGDNWTSLYAFILAYRDNTTAMGLITNDKLSNITNRQFELIAIALNNFLPRANPSEKENIQRVIDIIDQKLHPISFAIKSSIKYLFSFI